jgi:uncharacterized coiled-coil DUF342 family protein
LRFYTQGSQAQDSIARIESLRHERDTQSKKVTDLMKDINTLSTQMENLIAENRALRQMAGVPDNYGI